MKSNQILASAALLASSIFHVAPVFAQDAPEEIVVTGNYGRVSDRVSSLSQAVSYADLDLGTKAGRDLLRHRVNLTARFLCDKLGESSMSDPLLGSCRQNAVDDAMRRVGTLEATASPRGTTWVRPNPWVAPYPTDWDSRYP